MAEKDLVGHSIVSVERGYKDDIARLVLDNGLKVWAVGIYGEEATLFYGEVDPNDHT